uniref:DUF4440 domain-containing protein n=1 Tax=Rhabditophanes sp. KR3021 TaxID=114890 RepID=A0AC35UBJ8_9BILA
MDNIGMTSSCNGHTNHSPEENLFQHIPMRSKIIENMNMALFQQIKARQSLFMKFFNCGNAQKVAELYDPEGYFMPNQTKPVKGRGGIEEYFKKDMLLGVQRVNIITEEVNGCGEWAFERGCYHLLGLKGTESGVYLQVWKNIDGQWLIHNDCFNVIKAVGSK